MAAELARVAVVPLCPTCGRHVLYLRAERPGRVGELIPVECDCGWVGLAPRSMRVAPEGDPRV